MNNAETSTCCVRHRLLLVLATVVLMGWSAILSAQTNTPIIFLSGNMNFGTVAFGSYTERILTISNAGDSTLTVSNIYISSPPEPVYLFAGFSGTWYGTIAPGGNQKILITFAPASSQNIPDGGNVNFSGLLSVESDATSGNPSIPVAAIGTFSPPVASISLNPTNLNFGKVEIGGLAMMELAITNSGNSVLTISNITLPDGFLFSWFGPDMHSVSATVDPESGTNFYVFFSPTNVADYAGTVTINSDATVGTAQFTVSGEGEYPTGRYVGLFYPLFTDVALDNSGQFSATAAAGGAVSGVLQLAGKRYPFSGRFSGSAAFSTELTNGLYLSFRGYPGICEGTLSNGTWIANLDAYRLAEPRGPFVGFKPGKYQIAIAGSTNLLLAPTNDGSGTINISASRAVHLSGTLGDGTKFSQATMFCGGSQIPFYTPLYGGQGVALGWIHCVVEPTNLVEGMRPPVANPPPLTNIIGPITNIVLTNFPPLTNPVPGTNILTLKNSSPAQIEPALDSLSRPGRTGRVPAPVLPHIFGTNYIWGSINWFKPPQIDTNYPSGFSFETSVSGPLP